MKVYPNFNPEKITDFDPEKTNDLLKKINDLLKFIIRERNNTDVQAFNSLPQVFVSGRKVGKVPGASNAVSTSDRLGDVNWDDQYIYVLTLDALGNPAWGRSALDTSW